jgi:hypothetical protein
VATWVEDIIQALKDFGGKGSLSEIYDEVALIRKEPMPQPENQVFERELRLTYRTQKTLEENIISQSWAKEFGL